MTLNLVQHRAQPSIWDHTNTTDWDTERWMAAVLAGAFLVAGFRRRSTPGLLLALGGSALAWWAASTFPASDPPSWTPTTSTSGPCTPEPAH